MKYVYVTGTFDTKCDELHYIADCLRAAGAQVLTADLGTGADSPATEVDFSASDIAAFHPEGEAAVLACGYRGEAIAAMTLAFTRFLSQRDDIAGVIGAGGSGGTALLGSALQTLPVGLPKLLVSTVASGNVAPYVGSSDIAMMYSVTDVQGLHRISRKVLGNAAHAMAGMVLNIHRINTQVTLPAVGLTMFGVTTPCVQAVTSQLRKDYDCLVFHATGTGGRSMEKLVDSGLLSAVLDLTTTEIADLLVGGVFAATDDRMGAVIRTGCPYIGSVGAVDMVNFGARDTVPGKFEGRRLFHIHNPQVTLMRTSVDENRAIAQWIALRLNQMQGPVRFLLPEGGVSMLDSVGQPFLNRQASNALFDTLERDVVQTEKRKLVRVKANINDREFVDAVLEQFRQVMACSA